MPSLSDIRNTFKFQRQAKKIQSELKNIHIEAEGPGVHVVIAASLEVVSIDISPDAKREQLPAILIDTINRAFKKAQVVASERMQSLMGQMGMPGAAS